MCDFMIKAVFHRQGGEVLLAACESELFGRCLESDDLVLDLGSEFYNGEEVNGEEFCGMLVQATQANIVGHEAVRLAIQQNMVHPDSVIEICGIPHAMFICM